MLVPQRLQLRNYSQHRALDITFADGVTCITGPNGAGKSNLFHAIRFALTGLQTPGSERLDQNILDGANFATVDLEFTFGAGHRGRVVRTINRKSANTVSLELVYADGRKEIETSSNKAVARFGAILDNSPKVLCEVNIAEQREIEALLYSNKRIEHFTKVLHGDTFSAPLALLITERERLFVDDYAQDRIKGLQDSIRSAEEKVEQLTSQSLTLKRSVESKRAQQLQEKVERVAAHAALVETWTSLGKDTQQAQSEIQQLRDSISAIPADLATQIKQLREQVATLSAGWLQYGTWRKLKEDEGANQAKLTQLTSTLQQHQHILVGLRSKQERLSLLKRVQTFLELSRTATTLTEAQKASEVKLTQLAEELTQVQAPLPALNQSVGEDEGLYKLLLEAKTALSAHNHGGGCCPLCETQMDAGKLALFDTRLQGVQARVQENRGKRDTLTKRQTAIISEQSSLKQIVKQVTEQLGTVKQALLQAGTIETGGLTEAACVKEVAELTPLIEQIPAFERKETTLLSEKGSTQTRLNEIQASLAAYTSEPTQPDVPESLLPELKKKLSTMEEQSKDVSVKEGRIISLLAHTASLERKRQDVENQAHAQKLPPVTHEFKLSEEETTQLNEDKQRKEQLQTVTNELAAQTAFHAKLQGMLQQAEEGVAHAKETKEYGAYLDLLSKRLKQLPYQILQGQLTLLCQKMDEIIREFQLKTPFSLSVSDKLDFIIKYPNGITRPITMASGGERIILGISFRLAAHKQLAPHSPWLAIDEPTNYLNQENIGVMADLVNRLRSNLGRYNLKKLIICTHSPIIAAQTDHTIALR